MYGVLWLGFAWRCFYFYCFCGSFEKQVRRGGAGRSDGQSGSAPQLCGLETVTAGNGKRIVSSVLVLVWHQHLRKLRITRLQNLPLLEQYLFSGAIPCRDPSQERATSFLLTPRFSARNSLFHGLILCNEAGAVSVHMRRPLPFLFTECVGEASFLSICPSTLRGDAQPPPLYHQQGRVWVCLPVALRQRESLTV